MTTAEPDLIRSYSADPSSETQLEALSIVVVRALVRLEQRKLRPGGAGGRRVYGGQFRRLAASRGVDAFILVSWSEESPMLADPATVGYAWRLDELEQLGGNDEPDFDRYAYEQGLRWCTAFSCVTPEGEDGWLADENLIPLSQDELDHARLELRRGSEEVLDSLFARAAMRTI